MVQRTTSSRSETKAIETPIKSNLLDVYTFPSLSKQKEYFTADVGRLPDFVDIDLAEIEAFARLAHYRSRVLVNEQIQLEQLDRDHVQLKWLEEFDQAVNMLQQKRSSVAGSNGYLTEIHSRMLFQLNRVHSMYVLRYGTTRFSEDLARSLKILKVWKFHGLGDLVERLQRARAIGVEEEKRRNLEFYYVQENTGYD